jgi:hypothetical protein
MLGTEIWVSFPAEGYRKSVEREKCVKVGDLRRLVSLPPPLKAIHRASLIIRYDNKECCDAELIAALGYPEYSPPDVRAPAFEFTCPPGQILELTWHPLVIHHYFKTQDTIHDVRLFLASRYLLQRRHVHFRQKNGRVHESNEWLSKNTYEWELATRRENTYRSDGRPIVVNFEPHTAAFPIPFSAGRDHNGYDLLTTVDDIISYIQTREECRSISSCDIQLLCEGRPLPGTLTLAAIPGDTLEVRRGAQWDTETVTVSCTLPNGLVDTVELSRSATVAHVRDTVARRHYVQFDRFILSRFQRKEKLDPSIGLPSETLRRKLGSLHPSAFKGIFANSVFLVLLYVRFPPGGRPPPPGLTCETKDDRQAVRLYKVSLLDRVFDLRENFAAGKLPLCDFRLKCEGDILDDEAALATLGLHDNMTFDLEWRTPPVARVYFDDLDQRRRVLDVVCQPPVTYRSVAHRFHADEMELTFEYKGKPLLGSEFVDARAIDPNFPIELGLRELSVGVTSSRGFHKVPLKLTTTSAAVCGSLQHFFPDVHTLALCSSGKPLKPDAVIVDVNPDLNDLELRDTPPRERQFRFREGQREFVCGSVTGVLASVVPEIARRVNKNFIVQSRGVRVDDTAQLDPDVVYEVVPLAQHVTVRLEPLGGGRTPWTRVVPLADPRRLTFAALFAQIELDARECRVYFHAGELRDPIDVGTLGQDPTLVVRYPAPLCPCSYSFTGAFCSTPFTLAVRSPERVSAMKARLVAGRRRPDIVPTAIGLSFAGVLLENDRDLLSYAVPAGGSITVTHAHPFEIGVVYDGRTTDYVGSEQTTAGELAAFVASGYSESPDDVHLEAAGTVLAPDTVLACLGVAAFTAVVQTIFEFTRVRGIVTLRLPKTATLGDARRVPSGTGSRRTSSASRGAALRWRTFRAVLLN